MKLIAYLVEVAQNRKSDFRFVFLSPLFSTKSFYNLRNQNLKISHLILKMSLHAFLVIIYFSLCLKFKPNLSFLVFSYLVAPGIYLFTLAMGSILQCCFYLTGNRFVDIHDRPYLSYSLTDFWSKRWNRWIRDWLNNLTYGFKFSNLTIGVLVSFFISGIFHEIMFNLPYFLFKDEFVFGNMMIFFSLQSLGILFEKQFLRQTKPIYRRMFMWIMVIGLSPIFVREPLLSVFGLLE